MELDAWSIKSDSREFANQGVAGYDYYVITFE